MGPLGPWAPVRRTVCTTVVPPLQLSKKSGGLNLQEKSGVDKLYNINHYHKLFMLYNLICIINNPLLIRVDKLCQPNLDHNTIVGASGIMPA